MAADGIFLVTGPAAAGKSTVARLLAERFPRGVHLEGDVFRRSIVSGREEMVPEAPAEAIAQLRLRYRLAAAAAETYLVEGFTVVWEDVIAGELLGECIGFTRARPLHVVVLLPSTEVIAAREGDRAADAYAQWSIEQLHAGFVDGTPRVGLWLNNSKQTPAETVDEITSRLGEALVPS